jgi:hypothetical protein
MVVKVQRYHLLWPISFITSNRLVYRVNRSRWPVHPHVLCNIDGKFKNILVQKNDPIFLLFCVRRMVSLNIYQSYSNYTLLQNPTEKVNSLIFSQSSVDWLENCTYCFHFLRCSPTSHRICLHVWETTSLLSLWGSLRYWYQSAYLSISWL